MTHHFPLTVYYEDTDMAGIVYYANYLKFIERGRSTLVAEAGIDQNAMRQYMGAVFAVSHVDARYLKPAIYGDALMVATKVKQLTGARILFDQIVMRDDVPLFSSLITVVCLNKMGSLMRLPAEIRAKIQDFSAK